MKFLNGGLKPQYRHTLTLGAAFAAAMTLSAHLASLDLKEVKGQKVQVEPIRWNASAFKAGTFGHLAAAVDWLWMRGLQDSSLAHVKAGEHPAIYYDFDLATDLDPLFKEAYTSGAPLLVIIRDDKTGARDLLLKGNRFRKEELPKYTEEFKRRFWPSAGMIPYLLTYIYIYELNDMPKAAEAIREVAELPDAPFYFKSLAKRVATRAGQYEVAIKLVGFILSQARDDRIQDELELRLQGLKIGQTLLKVNEDFDVFKVGSAKRTRSVAATEASQIQTLWDRFRASRGIARNDPWGGHWIIRADGKITTDIPHLDPYGLER